MKCFESTAVLCPKCKHVRTNEEIRQLIFNCPNGCGLYEDYANKNIRCVECNASHTRKADNGVMFCPVCGIIIRNVNDM